MISMAARLKALLAVGVDRKLFEFEPPEAEVGVATALESALLWWLRTELVSIPIRLEFYEYNSCYCSSLKIRYLNWQEYWKFVKITHEIVVV